MTDISTHTDIQRHGWKYGQTEKIKLEDLRHFLMITVSFRLWSLAVHWNKWSPCCFLHACPRRLMFISFNRISTMILDVTNNIPMHFITIQYKEHGCHMCVLKSVRLAQNGTYQGLFKIICLYILAGWTKMYWNLIIKDPQVV